MEKSSVRQPTLVEQPKNVPLRIIGASIGNILILWDGVIFGFLTTVIAQLFFPFSTQGILFTLIFFGLGYLLLPVGTAVFGHIGDRYGRRTALLLTFWLVGLGTLLTGALPTYAAIGYLAPGLLLALRFVIGFGGGGEWGGVGAYLVELGGARKRAYYSSWQQFSTLISNIMGLVAGTLVSIAGNQFMLSVGWRLPFLIGGALLIPIALVVRLRMPESEQFQEIKTKREISRAPILGVFRKNWKAAILTMPGSWLWSVQFGLMIVYMPTYLVSQAGFTLSQALVIGLVGTVFFTLLVPIWGYLSDRVLGRKKVALLGSIGWIVLPYPLFALIRGGDFTTALLAVLALDFFIAPLSGVLVAWIGESFPTNVRASSYIPSLTAQILGFGFSGAVSVYLLAVTGNPAAVALYGVAAGVVGTIGFLLMKETAHIEKLPETDSIYLKLQEEVPV